MPPRVEEFRWPPGIQEKVYSKHGLEQEEVEEAFFYRRSLVRKSGAKYLLYTRTDEGRYSMVVYSQFGRIATVISGREMTPAERRMFGRK